MTKAVFLDIDADELLRFKLCMLNLLEAVAIAVVIIALHAIRFLLTLFSRLFVLL